MVIGIDALNIFDGGGITHLKNILEHVDWLKGRCQKIIIWCNDVSKQCVPNHPLIEVIEVHNLKKNLLKRLLWQIIFTSYQARKNGCHVLLIPGSMNLGFFKPTITMFRNMLPFAIREKRRYGFSFDRLRLELLYLIQRFSFKRSDKVVVLTQHAQQTLSHELKLHDKVVIIPHGIDHQSLAFNNSVAKSTLKNKSDNKAFKWLYVSRVSLYKHQWNVVEAIAQLKREGLSTHLTLVGPPHPKALPLLEQAIALHDPASDLVNYVGGVRSDEIQAFYQNADGFIFASSCENMPNILLEAMSFDLPIACSDIPPMPDLLRDGGVFFNPECPKSIADALRTIMTDDNLREKLVVRSRNIISEYSWEKSASSLFDLVFQVGSAV